MVRRKAIVERLKNRLRRRRKWVKELGGNCGSEIHLPV
jgi:hypothetical protein